MTCTDVETVLSQLDGRDPTNAEVAAIFEHHLTCQCLAEMAAAAPPIPEWQKVAGVRWAWRVMFDPEARDQILGALSPE